MVSCLTPVKNQILRSGSQDLTGPSSQLHLPLTTSFSPTHSILASLGPQRSFEPATWSLALETFPDYTLLRSITSLDVILSKKPISTTWQRFATTTFILLYFSPYRLWPSNIQEKVLIGKWWGEVVDCFFFTIEYKRSFSKHDCNLVSTSSQLWNMHTRSAQYICIEWMSDWFEPRRTIFIHGGTFHIVHFPYDERISRKSHGDYCHQVSSVVYLEMLWCLKGMRLYK